MTDAARAFRGFRFPAEVILWAVRHLDGVDAPRRHRCAKVVVLNNHHRGGVHGPG